MRYEVLHDNSSIIQFGRTKKSANLNYVTCVHLSAGLFHSLLVLSSIFNFYSRRPIIFVLVIWFYTGMALLVHSLVFLGIFALKSVVLISLGKRQLMY